MTPSRILAYGILAALAAVMWARLLAEPPVLRLVAVWGIAMVLVVALAVLRRGGSGTLRAIAAAALSVVGVVAGLAALGLPVELLVPGGWDELGPTLDEGIEGLRGKLDLPAGELAGIARPLLLAALPILLVVAALIASAPRSRRNGAIWALAILIGAFAIPAAARPDGAAAIWGVALLAAIALWLWGARVAAPAAIAAIGAAAAVAVPVASAIEPEEPPVDYEEWAIPEPPQGTDFAWDHRYGPIDWTRTGDTVLEVRTEEPRYLRASVLDEFFAFGWRRSPMGGPATPPADPASLSEWAVSAELTVVGLESDQLIAPGEMTAVSGTGDVERSADGTVTVAGEPLSEGTSYTVDAYAPEPSPEAMRAASRGYDPELASYTALTLPADLDVGTGGVVRLTPPLLGTEGAAPDELPGYVPAGYARMARLADRLVAGSPSGYDAAVAVSDHLAQGFEYDERPPPRTDPLPGFLFTDRRGYCQQFSGAMAMLLRMGGVPARVAAGFTPGERIPGEESVYKVTDLDAHSWVEVYFDGIGWVPFDPTPPDSPAGSQDVGADGAGGATADAQDARDLARAREPAVDRGVLAAQPADSGSGSGALLVLAVLAGLGLIAILAARLRALSYRRLPRSTRVETALREVAPALRAVGRPPAGSATLLELERDLRSAGRPRAADYLARLAALRYRPGADAGPRLSDRRGARRDLGSGRTLSERLRLLLAMPPGAPSGTAHH